MSKMRVVIVDDSQTELQFMGHVLSQSNHIEVVQLFRSPIEALQKIKELSPDVVISDMMMPEMNGFEFVKKVTVQHKIPCIVISAFYSESDKVKTMESFNAGAIAIFEKPVGNSTESAKILENILKTIKEIEASNKIKSTSTPVIKKTAIAQYDLIAIGCSLGGPQTLTTFFSTLPTDVFTPIVIVQHIMEGYENGFAEWLSKTTGRSVEIAKHLEPVRKNHIYLAPGDKHLLINAQKKFVLSNDPPVHSLRPAADKLFFSLVDTYKHNCIAILLSGMGSDGVDGMEALYKAGAYTIAQHQDGCIMYGMPKKAVERNIVKAVIPIRTLGKEVGNLVK